MFATNILSRNASVTVKGIDLTILKPAGKMAASSDREAG